MSLEKWHYLQPYFDNHGGQNSYRPSNEQEFHNCRFVHSVRGFTFCHEYLYCVTPGCPATKIIALGNSVEVVTVDALDMAVEGQIDSIAYLPGYTVQFHCSDSQLYTLAGPKSWTCSTQGQWEPSDQEPQCLSEYKLKGHLIQHA